jgi:hypothetical protein
MDNTYNCVLSLGIRCFTEIFLDKLKFKKFSSPFDGLYLSSINDIIYLLTNKIQICDLIHTKDDAKYQLCNDEFGCRSLHSKLENTIMNTNKNIDTSYHYATFPHHNLKDSIVLEHFNRCFNRLDIIENNKIKTLMCLFIHPTYPGYVKITHSDIEQLSLFLQKKYKCHLLVIYFFKKDISKPYIILENNPNYTIYNINNSSHIFDNVKNELQEIFDTFNLNEKDLLTYDYFNIKIK